MMDGDSDVTAITITTIAAGDPAGLPPGAPMRLLHTSDWHLGRTLYGVDLLPHQAAFLGWLLQQAVTHQAHAVVVAGDVYDRAVPPTEAVAVLDHALRGFAAARIPVVLTSGNHDS